MVPGYKGEVKNTANGTFTGQTYGGTILGLSTATSVITKAIQVKDINASDLTITTGPKLLSGNRTYNTAKILSAGAFAYNSNGLSGRTWLISRVATTLAGTSNSFLLYMGTGADTTSIYYYKARPYLNTISLVRKNQFSRTGWAANGTKIKKRTTWITDPTSSAGADFGTSNSLPTRALPGEGYFLTNFTDYNPATSSNKFYYKPITGK